MAPLHPALVHFPIGLMVFSFITDLLARFFPRASLRAAALWSLTGALIGAGAAAASGYYDITRDTLGETYKYADFHMDVGLILGGCLLVLTLWRWIMYGRKDYAPGAIYLVAALLVMGMTLFQGWYGGEMVYSQGAGVAAAGKGTEPASNGKQLLDKVTRTEGR